jgi:aspartate racemase
MNELVNAVFLSETKERLLAIVEKLKASQEIDGLILGGTELPLILRDGGESGIPLLDTGKIHSEAAVAAMF